MDDSQERKYKRRIVEIMLLFVAIGAWFLPNPLRMGEAVPSPTVTTTVTVPEPGPTVTATQTVTNVAPFPTEATPQPAEATSSAANQNSKVRLVDVPPIIRGNHFTTKTVKVRGISILNALVISQFSGPAGNWSDMRHIPLNGSYSKLTGSVAIADDSYPGAEVVIEIEVDGKTVFTGTSTVGQEPEVFGDDFDIIGAEDLKLKATQTTLTGRTCTVVFIDGELTLA